MRQLLRQRGLLFQDTPSLAPLLDGGPRSVYCGFDPTADSLHVGSLVSLMTLRHLENQGHQPVLLMGGATGLIGDPSGKNEERQMISEEVMQSNIKGIQKDAQLIVPNAQVVNNYDWYRGMDMISFLRHVGKHFRVQSMMRKDSVRARMESDQGISYTEFSYQCLQGYDFYRLYRDHGVQVQLGGSDQWGNISAGIELIHRLTPGQHTQVGAITVPLLVGADGRKLGKSAGNAVWLDAKKTSNYDFYQYFLRIEDSIVEWYLKLLTFLPESEIQDLMVRHAQRPESRIPQRALAEAVTGMVRGELAAREAREASEGLFGGGASVEQLLQSGAPFTMRSRESINGSRIATVISEIGFVPSKGEARRLISQGGLYVDNQRVSETNARFPQIAGDSVVLRAGKKKYIVIKLS